jgi:drug/metabolite transporter, DME family
MGGAARLASPVYALAVAVIWAVSPIYYRLFLAKFDFLSFNFFRTASASAVLALPALYYWSFAGLGFAIPSGVFTLACGDSLFLLSLREIGASVATPVVYTYVLMIQLVGSVVGQAIPYANFVAAAMVLAGVYVLSKGGGGKPRPRGIGLAISAGVLWTVGQELIQASTNAGGNFVVVTFASRAAAAVALGVVFMLTRKKRTWPSGLGARDYAFMLMFIISDLAIGSTLFVYSVSIIGVALTVILTSLSPLLTQLFAKALGKESPSSRDFFGGALIVAALVLAVAF